MKPLVTNAADEAQVKNAAQKSRTARENEIMDLHEVLSTKAGRRLVWRYLELCGVFRTSFNNSGSVTAFNEGCRNIGLMILSDVNDASPDYYAAMQKESKEKV